MLLVKHLIIYVNKNFVSTSTTFCFKNKKFFFTFVSLLLHFCFEVKTGVKKPSHQAKIITNVLENVKAKPTVGHATLIKSDLGMEGQISCRQLTAGFNWLQQSCYLHQLKMDLKSLEGIISTNIFFVILIFVRKPNCYTLPDVARQTDVTPNFRCIQLLGMIFARLISSFIEVSIYA